MESSSPDYSNYVSASGKSPAKRSSNLTAAMIPPEGQKGHQRQLNTVDWWKTASSSVNVLRVGSFGGFPPNIGIFPTSPTEFCNIDRFLSKDFFHSPSRLNSRENFARRVMAECSNTPYYIYDRVLGKRVSCQLRYTTPRLASFRKISRGAIKSHGSSLKYLRGVGGRRPL